MVKKLFIALAFLNATNAFTQTGKIQGIIVDQSTKETLPGANIFVEELAKGTISDLDGSYFLELQPGTYTIKVSFVSFNTAEIPDVKIEAGKTTTVDISLEESSTNISEVVISTIRKTSSEVAMLATMKTAHVVMSGVSAQQITKTQDSNASEVIRRVPGISIIDDKFVIARGLSQRYNNVWINNSAVPSSEADARSFSFDMVPGSQIENVVIIKSPAPELPADFTGGFIKLATKGIPTENQVQVSYGVNFNSQTQFHDFLYNKGSSTDFLGFDNGKRGLRDVAGNHSLDTRMDNNHKEETDNITKNGFNNDWNIRNRRPISDQRLSVMLNRRMNKWGLIAALNYTYANRTYANMKNARYGIYNIREDQPEYIYSYTDNQYNTDVRLGGMFNLTYMANDRNRFEFRHIVNQLGKNRYTDRTGYQYISGYYQQGKQEYLYSSRLGYSGQFSGIHTLSEKDQLDWTLGYSYANKNQPDRRIIELEENGFPEDTHYGQMQIDQNDIFREFIKLHENIVSVGINYTHDFEFNHFTPFLKSGIYGEYRDRNYHTRGFYYRWNQRNMPDDFAYWDMLSQVLIPENYGADKLYIYEDSDYRNNYLGNSHLLAAYVGMNLPWKKWNIYAGVRMEINETKLTSYTAINDNSLTKIYTYPQTDLFPSVNATYNFNKEHLLRFAYGSSVNRQEFREMSPSVYYDFDLFSAIKGNPDLKPAYIHNFDLRYEFYPVSEEVISFALFYKNFSHPIEWTYLDAGGSYTYTFENARSANNYGIEIDVKKGLDFIGMPHFSLSLNASFIKSIVQFGDESLEHDRPMQGQSPYLVNTGIFYQDAEDKWMFGLFYNIIGKRIVGIGKVDTSNGSSINNDIPDMYEMPRNVFDLTLRRKLGKRFEINATIRDILAQPIVFKQFPKFFDEEGNITNREQTTKKFKPGQNMAVALKVNF